MKTTADLLALCRQVLRDKRKPYLWSDDELVGWGTEAQERAARNARLIRDFSTPEICQIKLTTARQDYDLDPRIIFVRRLTLDSRARPLAKVSYHDLDQRQSGWLTRTGTPDLWCTDFESGKVWFNRKPTAADTARLFVVRIPLCDLATTNLKAELEVAAAYRRPLHHYVCGMAYSKDDTDTKDDAKAAFHLGKFAEEFGEQSNAIDEEWERQHYGDADMEAQL